MRHREANLVPLRKTFQIVYILEDESLTTSYYLTGNDLETSEILYSSLFYIKSKERIYNHKGSKLFPSNKNNPN